MVRREKRFRRYLSADDILHFRIVREDGKVVEVAIGYELVIEGVSYHVCHVDNAHGELHMDQFNVQGEKIGRKSLGHVDSVDLIPKGLEILLEAIEAERLRIITELGYLAP